MNVRRKKIIKVRYLLTSGQLYARTSLCCHLRMRLYSDSHLPEVESYEIHVYIDLLEFVLLCLLLVRSFSIVFVTSTDSSGHVQACLVFIHSFIPDTSITPLPVHCYSEALPTTASILHRS